jgi:hypothetical protein
MERDRVIGQYRGQKKRAWESPDEQDRFRHWKAVPLPPTPQKKGSLGTLPACAGCGRTKDLWEENNGAGLSKNGRHFCCKPCASGDPCTCINQEDHKGQELGGLLRSAPRRKR